MLLSCQVMAKSRLTLCNPMDCSMPGLPVPHHLLEFAQVYVHCISDAIQPFHPLLPFLLPSVFPSIRIFSNESALHIRWPKYWSFSISPSSEYSGLISFRMYWFDLLAVQGSLQHHKSLFQHHSLKAPILQCSVFFMIQLSHCTWLLERPQLWLYRPLSAKWSIDISNHKSRDNNKI